MGIHREMLIRGVKKGTIRELLYIDSVPNGEKCGCVCPECGEPLSAKNGGKGGPRGKSHHFAHVSGRECHYAPMTELHLFAQNLLARGKKVMLPAYCEEYVSYSAEFKEFDHVELEQVYKDNSSTRKPDCVCSKEGDPKHLWVEIYCRHKVDEVRKNDIKKRGEYCIEIDFDDILSTKYTEEIVLERLITDTKHKRWISHPEWDAENERLRLEEFKRQRAETRKQLEAEEKRKEESLAKLHAAEQMRKKLLSLTPTDIIPTNELVQWLGVWGKHERDYDRKYLVEKEIWQDGEQKRARYQNIAGLWQYEKTLIPDRIYTQSTIYELFKYAMLGVINVLEQNKRTDLIERLLTDQEILEQYLVLVSFSIQQPLIFDAKKISELKQRYNDLWRIYNSTSYVDLDSDLSEIITIINHYRK